MRDREITDFLAGVVGVVEANSYEHHMLWSENEQREKPLPWKQNNCGLGETVGHIGKMPVFVSLFTAEVDGHKLLFIFPTSQVIDHRMIEKWLKRTLPRTAFCEGGYVNKTDAMNFHNVFRRRMAQAA